MLCYCVLAGTGLAESGKPVVLENSLIRYSISSDARNLAFIDRSTGTNYLRASAPGVCAAVRVKGKEFAANAAALENGRLKLSFGDTGLSAILRIESRSS